MVSLVALSAVAVMIASGAIAAPWQPSVHHHTHRSRGVGPTGVNLWSYHPPSVFEGYGVAGVDNPLGKRATPEEAAKSFLQNKLGVTADSLTRHAGHTWDGVSYEYFTQTINGIPIANAVANVALKGDKVMSYGASFVKPKIVAAKDPSLSLDKAIAMVEKNIGGKFNQWPLKLQFIAKDDGNVVLTHVVQVQGTKNSEWKQVYVDANNGEIVNVADFVANASYRAVPLNYQDPTEKYVVITDPQDMRASPKGWHSSTKDKGQTSGNNVISYKGADANPPDVDNLTGSKVAKTTYESSVTNNYAYPYNPTVEPQVDPNVDAARVNTFYVVNAMHDLTYKYGFTESAYNFQDDNFGKGGKAGDRIQVSVQDSSGVNDARFSAPPDGQPGQMRMFTWTLTVPQRDGALENDIVVHEFTHGVSNRLTGGGTAICLQTTEAGGLAEGWSDAMADLTEAKTRPIPDFITGKYVANYPPGIRSHPYSTNMTTNPLTYASLNSRDEVHAIGEVWALMLHELFAALVDIKGISDKFDPKSESGNSVMLHLFMDGLMLQPCNPTFISARDAIIQAGRSRYGEKYTCTIWKAFAKRGLGTGATAERKDNKSVPRGC